jgi:hypothetical protein
VFLEVALAQANALRRDFDQLVVGDEFNGFFQRQLDRRFQAHGFVRSRGAHIGKLLALDWVDYKVVVTAVDADDHALVHRLARVDEHAPTLLQFP